MMFYRKSLFALLVFFSSLLFADGPADNIPDKVRRIPRLGIELTDQQKGELEVGLHRLRDSIDALAKSSDPQIRLLLPDVEIFYRAVHDAKKHREFFKEREVDEAKKLIERGIRRAEMLSNGKPDWNSQAGLIVRGYRSKIDHSVQPYGLVIPSNYSPDSQHNYRLDVWFHGRGETLSEVNFLTQRSKNPGTFQPQDTIVLHTYGRYSNAFKFAGEVDVLEAIESVQENYRIDNDRISVRGFSMGGAACWQFAVHYADRWFAANPGAGFSETPRFLKSFQKETLNPTWFEEKLWRMYDCNLWARNLIHCPTVAYSGENDIQKQAADVMAEALSQHGIPLTHIIGPKTGHRYHPESAEIVTTILDRIAEKGRDRFPKRVDLTTYTLKYNRMSWLTINGLRKHWEKSRCVAEIASDHSVEVSPENVTEFSLSFPAGWAPFDPGEPVAIHVNGMKIGEMGVASDRSWKANAFLDRGRWRIGQRESNSLRKSHNLQGPIDDAFMDSFIFVRPTSKSRYPLVEKWASSELERAIEHWRRHFRGDARVKRDDQVTDNDIATANLVLWGDPNSNSLIKRISDQLPIRWTRDRIVAGEREFDSSTHALIAIYPNPLNPSRYVVLNSSFTFREFAYLNNARQVPKLPDWAIVDLETPPDTLWPGRIADANFFDERWRFREER